MAIPPTTQPLPSRSVIEFTVGKPNSFPNSTSSRAFGNPSQSYVPGFGTPSNVLLGFDQIQAEITVPGNASAALTFSSVSGTVAFPNIQFPFITGTSEAVYALLTAQIGNVSQQFMTGARYLQMSYQLQQAQGTSPAINVNAAYALTRQVTAPVLGVGEIQPLPTNATITGINVAFTQGFYNQVASPAAGTAYLVFTLFLIVNTGFVAQM